MDNSVLLNLTLFPEGKLFPFKVDHFQTGLRWGRVVARCVCGGGGVCVGGGGGGGGGGERKFFPVSRSFFQNKHNV